MKKTAVNYPEGQVHPTFDLAYATKCIAERTRYVIRGGEVHRGSYGRVYGVCAVDDPHIKEPDKCSRRIVKIILFPYAPDIGTPDEVAWNKQLEAEAVEDLQRELYIFHLLNNSGITPHIYEEFGCGNYFNIVLERFRTNMLQTGKQQLQKARKVVEETVPWQVELDGALLYTDAQMERMFAVAQELGSKWGVIHGDLGPHQYLFPLNGELFGGSKGIVVSDFGFSSASGARWHAKLGWNYPDNCGAFSPIPPLADSGNAKLRKLYSDHYNVFQLCRYFSYRQAFTYVLVGEKNTLAVFPHHSFPFSSPDSPYHIPKNLRDRFSQLPKTESGRACPKVPRNPQWPLLYQALPLWPITTS